MKIFVTSDTHFGHENIIKFCNRPFKNAHFMDLELIERWNSVVTPDDIVYHLGDFAYKISGNKIINIIEQLNGKIILIKGNHDGKTLKVNSVHNFFETQNYVSLTHDNKKVCLFHFPIEEWDGKHNGSIHLHGHSHGVLDFLNVKNRLDVGVDSHNFTPVELSTAILLAQK